MEHHHKIFFAVTGVGGSVVNSMETHAHDIMGVIAFWAGGVAAVLSVIAFSWDIYNKWRHRND